MTTLLPKNHNRHNYTSPSVHIHFLHTVLALHSKKFRPLLGTPSGPVQSGRHRIILTCDYYARPLLVTLSFQVAREQVYALGKPICLEL